MSGLAPVLAHQGGWDELLLFAVPAFLAVGALRWAERRARARGADGNAAEEEAPAPPDAAAGESSAGKAPPGGV